MENTNTPMSAPQHSSAAGIVSLILGILAIIICWIPIINNLSAVAGIIGLIFGIVAILRIKKKNLSGKGVAVAGLILCILSIVITLFTQSLFSKAFDEATSGPKAAKVSDSQSAADKDAKKADKKDDGKEKDAAATQDLAVGKAVTLENGLTVSVDAVETAKDMGKKTYTLITVTYKNGGKEKTDFNSFDWKSTNADGAVSDAEIALFEDRSKMLQDGELNPGGTVTGKVPLKEDSIKAQYRGGLFSDKDAASWKLK